MSHLQIFNKSYDTHISVDWIQDIVSGRDHVTDLEVLATPERAYVFAFVPAEGLNPVVIDVTDPTKPVRLTVEYIPELYHSTYSSTYGKVFEKDGRLFVIVIGSSSYGTIRTFDFTDPTTPTFVSDWDEHGALYWGAAGADDIDVVELSGRTYAFPHDIFGIVDITNPDMPTVAAVPGWSVHDRPQSLDAYNLAIVDWSNSTYAVAFSIYGSIYTIDVTVPTRPALLASAREDSGGFGHLLPSGPVETFHMSGRTYALMPIQDFVGKDKAIQIVDITNPTLMAAAGIVPYHRVSDIGIVEAEGRVYALILGRQLQEHGWEYVNVMEIVAAGSTPNHTMSISHLKVAESTSHEPHASTNSQVQFTANLRADRWTEQHFTFLVQVQDANGMVVDLSWTTGSMGFGESITLAAGFTPPEPGTYEVTAFAWRSLDDPIPLAAPVSLNFTAD